MGIITGLLDRLHTPKKGNKGQLELRDLPVGQISQTGEDSWKNDLNAALFGINISKGYFPFELIEYITQFSLINPDLAQAVGNIVGLGNTGHTVEIFGDESIAEKAHLEIDELAARIYPAGAGVDGFIDDLLGQIARTGALSLEWVPNETLDGIKKVVLVPVKTVRFKYEGGDYRPVQNVEGWTSITQQYVELNPVTYLYYALERIDYSPYANPPFLAALNNLHIQGDMVGQLKYISKKLGIFGFLQVLISAPTEKPGESVDEYKARCRSYLESSAERVKGSFSDGVVLGFKDVQEFQHTNITADSRGARDLFQVNEELIASGIRQDPAMLGRSYSTTETYAGVVFEKMLSQIGSYQRLVKRAIEWGYYLHFLMRGVYVEKVRLIFNESNLVNQKIREESRKIKIENENALYDAGIIDQDTRARNLGYKEPALPMGRNELAENLLPEEETEQVKSKEAIARPALVLSYDKREGYKAIYRRRAT